MLKNDAVTIEDLTVVRGSRTVLPGIDVGLRSGVITGLLGPSGCGKSTLIRSIVGVQRVKAGTVRVLGEDAGSKSLRDRIGYVTQEPSVYDNLTVAENLTFFARVLGVSISDEVDAAIESVGLASHRDALVGNLSGGQRSRASLAVALLGQPPLLILDEPTVGLDPVLRVELWDMFAEFAHSGTTMLVSSHVMDEAERCDRLLLMREGRILASDTPQALCESTGTTSVEDAFLALVRGDEGAVR
ncbi:ABC transporter ATP-binding protein [Solicola gregarius]|uniref:ABC transporter ATP-binding protein n=1 Tax=Solicola gregarius TaxID=2908642 RepID=A0AA46YNS9_9ACTN|nr:ABC transporter ATP-binding protein [Solicola gregarius]UYM06958.1 ABC transporter ATP-binding protein [Solicola gregarius]